MATSNPSDVTRGNTRNLTIEYTNTLMSETVSPGKYAGKYDYLIDINGDVQQIGKPGPSITVGIVGGSTEHKFAKRTGDGYNERITNEQRDALNAIIDRYADAAGLNGGDITGGNDDEINQYAMDRFDSRRGI